MTKRILALCALLAMAAPCYAGNETHDVVVVTCSSAIGDDIAAVSRNKFPILFNILDKSRTDYVVIPATQVKTEWVRTGVFPISGANTITARSEILLGAANTTIFSSGGISGKVRLDSLSQKLTTRPMLVPSVWLLDNGGEGNTAGGNAGSNAWLDSTGSATHMATGVSGTMIPYTSAYFNINNTCQFFGSPGSGWWGGSYVTGYEMATYGVAGGVRCVLPMYTSAIAAVAELRSQGSDGKQNGNCKWPDSCLYTYPGTAATTDTMLVWDRPCNSTQFAFPSGAMPITFVKWAGVGWLLDSTTAINGGQPEFDSEGDASVLLFGLAHFDSLTKQYASDGRGYIFKNMREPFKLAPIVYGLGLRNLRRFSRGILPSDTSTAYASLDSIRAAGFKVTYAVDPDSAATYPRDIRKAMENGAARFTPQSWISFGPTGLDSTNVGSNASFAHPVDVWGHFRNRAFYGDSLAHTVMGSDSSITQLLIAQRSLLAGYVGRQRMSTCAVAPFDDYSPLTMTIGGAKGGMADSLIFAAQSAGYTCLVSNVRYRTSNPNYHPSGSTPLTNPWGWFTKQGQRYGRLAGRNFMILGHNEQPLYSGVQQFWTMDDSTAGTTITNRGTNGIKRALTGVLCRNPEHDLDQQACKMSPSFSNVTDGAGFYSKYKDIRLNVEEFNTEPQPNANVILLSFNSLSGDPANPARNGWWTLKYLNNAFKNINAAAGRTIITMCYPEEIAH